MEKVAYVLFLSVLMISPLAFGAMHPWAYTLMSLLVFVGAVMLLPGRIVREQGKDGVFFKIPNTGLNFFFMCSIRSMSNFMVLEIIRIRIDLYAKKV